MGSRARRQLGLASLASLGLLIGCAGPAQWSDFTSVSKARSNDGYLIHPARLDYRGKGYRMGKTWRDRGRRYGTDELVAAIEHAAASVRSEHGRRSVLAVADISAKGGGDISKHSSHESGRDVDLIFYAIDSRGIPMSPPEVAMVRYGGDGKPIAPEDDASEVQPDWEERRFDTKRNWALVEALLSDPDIRVQWMFVSNGLKDRMIRYAVKKERPAWLIEYAKVVMRQPLRAAPHDDHFHVRIYCSRADRERGCVDGNPVWQHEKKTFKYDGPEVYAPDKPPLWPLPVFLPVG